MGIFDSFKKMMQGNTSEATPEVVSEKVGTVIFAPITGKVVDLTEVPDPVFAEKAVGDGLAIEPTDNKVVAPFDGVITKLFHTHHAFIIQSDSGVEIMIHVGLDTVQLNGKGFSPKVKEGARVKTGDVILELDLEILKAKAKSVVTPVILLNEDDMGKITGQAKSGNINAGDVLYRVG